MPSNDADSQRTVLQSSVNWRTEQLIDDRFVRGEREPLSVENPATGEIIATLGQASSRQIDDAVRAARSAFDGGVWRDAELRARVLTRLADLLESKKADLKAALVTETGTPVSIGQFLQLDGPIDMLRYFAARTDLGRPRELGIDSRPPASNSVIRYEAVGVVAGIGAYNNPLLYLVSKSCAALAAGCTSVFLPSSLTPLTALLFGEIVREAGVPAGVLNIIAGGPEVAHELTLHPGIDKISMTGSVGVGKQVMRQAAEGLKGVVLELGGKSAGIILPGADLSAAALQLHGRYLRNSGQGCQSPTRLLVPQELFDDFIDLSREAYAKIPVGDPCDPATMAGPLIREAHRTRVEGYVERAVRSGAQILVGGGRPPIDRGWFMNGALLGGAGNDAEIATHELFGPVAIVIPYRDVEQAIKIANDSVFGLAASVFGPLEEAKQVASRLRVGTVSINGGGNFRVDSVLAGWKQSGLGKEWGEEGIMEFLQPLHIQWII